VTFAPRGCLDKDQVERPPQRGDSHAILPMTTRDREDPDSWFEHEFTPYSAVADYANEPPRGMTNPPMNLALRKVLCEDLVEYGLELEVPKWGTGFVRKSSSTPSSPSHTMTQSLQSQRLARSASSRAMLMSSYSEGRRSGLILKPGLLPGPGGSYQRYAPARSASVCEVTPAHPDWHQYHPFPGTLRPIDKRGPVSLQKKLRPEAVARKRSATSTSPTPRRR
jgi:hypothetical protein